MNLVPGHAYTVTIQTLSGKLNNSNAATGRTGETLDDGFKIQMESDELMLMIIDYCVVLNRPAPARVTALQADNDHTTHSLTVSWERPVGVYDGYSLQLLDEAGALVANRSVSVGSRSERLEGLTSGKWYRVRVVTLSGGVPSVEVTAEGQTRESRHYRTLGDAGIELPTFQSNLSPCLLLFLKKCTFTSDYNSTRL